MKELILKLSIEAPYAFPWKKPSKYQKLDIPQEEIIGYLRGLDISSIERRRQFSWSVELAIYESAANYNTLEDMAKNIRAKLEIFKNIYPLISDELITCILVNKGLNKEKNLEIFKRALKNTLTDKEKEEYKKEVTSWIIEIIVWNTVLRGFETATEIRGEVFKLLEDNYSYLNIDRVTLNGSLMKLGIGLGKTIEVFVSEMKIDKHRYEALLMKENIEEKVEKKEIVKDEKLIDDKKEKETKDDDLMESILGLFENMEEIEELKVEEKEVKKEAIKEKPRDKCESKVEKKVSSSEISPVYDNKEIANNEKEESMLCKTVGNGEEVYKKLAALAEVLDCELVDHSKVQVSREYYEKLNSSKSEEELVIKQLLSLEKGAVLSQLYNTYKNLNSTSVDNIEAVMSNFFSTLFAMGFEVNEEEACIGEKVTVNTKDLFKEFVFSKPVNKNGEINGQVKYLSWSYKDKIIMPKIIKPIE